MMTTSLQELLRVALALSLATALQAETREPEKSAVPSDDPAALVDSLHDTLLEAMKLAGQEAYRDRYGKIGPALRDGFDVPGISRLVLGKTWPELSEEERAAFVDVMRRFMTANYASNFDSFSDQRFEKAQTLRQEGRVAVVRSAFVSGDGKRRLFDYQLRKTSEGWRIVNVAVDGVSDLSLKRAEFADVIGKKGFEGLLQELETRIEELAAESGA